MINNARTSTDVIKSQTIALFRQHSTPIPSHIRNQIAELNVGLPLRVAKERHWGDAELFQDLFQIGMIGLLKAIENFDVNRNSAFSSYAMAFIRGELSHYFRDNAPFRYGLKVGRGYKDKYSLVVRTQKILMDSGRDLPMASVAQLCLVNDWDEIAAANLPGIVESVDCNDWQEIADTCHTDDDLESVMDAIKLLPTLNQSLLHRHYVDGWDIPRLSQHYKISSLSVRILIQKSVGIIRAIVL